MEISLKSREIDLRNWSTRLEFVDLVRTIKRKEHPEMLTFGEYMIQRYGILLEFARASGSSLHVKIAWVVDEPKYCMFLLKYGFKVRNYYEV